MLAANLHDYLLIHGALCIPDLGKFSWVKSASKMLNSTGSLKIGGAEVKFEHGIESMDSWNQFLQFSASKWELPLDQVNAQYNRELERWKNQLSNTDSLTIDGIGSLQSTALSSVVFVPEVFAIKGFAELPSIDLSPIQRVIIDQDISKEFKEGSRPDTKVRIKYGRELLFGFLLFLLFCLLYLWFIQPNWSSKENKRKLADFAHIDESRLNQDPVEFANGHAFDSAQDNIPENQETIIREEDTNSIESVIPEVDPIIDSVQENTCIIIVGSFLNMNRADKMEDRLNIENRKVHTEFYGDYKRIGYFVKCDSLIPELQDARSLIDPKSWILQ